LLAGLQRTDQSQPFANNLFGGDGDSDQGRAVVKVRSTECRARTSRTALHLAGRAGGLGVVPLPILKKAECEQSADRQYNNHENDDAFLIQVNGPIAFPPARLE
jgi:hypothetical protein